MKDFMRSGYGRRETSFALGNGQTALSCLDPNNKLLSIIIIIIVIIIIIGYSCETWYLTLREKHRLRVCKNRRIFWPQRDKNGE